MPVTVRNITTREFRDNLSEQLSRAAYSGDRIQILRNGQPIAMVVSMDDAEELRELDYYKDAADYRRAVAERNGDPLAMPTRNDVIVADGASARNDLARRLGSNEARHHAPARSRRAWRANTTTITTVAAAVIAIARRKPSVKSGTTATAHTSTVLSLIHI